MGAEALGPALERLSPQAPIAVLIHGYRYQPGHPTECPHRDLFAPDDMRLGVPSWPKGLGLTGDDGLAVCFGWSARGTLVRAYHQAEVAAAQLSHVLAGLRAVAPQRRIALMGHSLGARVALGAMAQAGAGCTDLALLLAPAELAAPGQRLAATPGVRSADVLCVDSAENRAFDLGFGLLMGAGTIGRAMPQAPNWHPLRLDCPAVLDALARLGRPVAPARARLCHWGTYSRPGTLPLYRALIDGSLPMPALRDALALASASRPRRRPLALPVWPASPGQAA